MKILRDETSVYGGKFFVLGPVSKHIVDWMFECLKGDFYIKTDVECDYASREYPNIIIIRRKSDYVMFKMRFG